MGGKKEFLLINQHGITAWLGCGARLLCWGQNRWILCQWTPLGRYGVSMARSPTRWAPTTNSAWGNFHRVQDSLLLFSPPELSQGQHTGPMSSPAGLVTPWGRCADGSGHSKAHTRHILAAPDPGGGCMLSQEREM